MADQDGPGSSLVLFFFCDSTAFRSAINTQERTSLRFLQLTQSNLIGTRGFPNENLSRLFKIARLIRIVRSIKDSKEVNVYRIVQFLEVCLSFRIRLISYFWKSPSLAMASPRNFWVARFRGLVLKQRNSVTRKCPISWSNKLWLIYVALHHTRTCYKVSSWNWRFIIFVFMFNARLGKSYHRGSRWKKA